jgi:hypothetical protein
VDAIRKELGRWRGGRSSSLDELLVLGDDGVEAARRQAEDHIVVLVVFDIVDGWRMAGKNGARRGGLPRKLWGGLRAEIVVIRR